MRSLIVSLYVAVFVTLLGLSWTIDRFYISFSAQEDASGLAGYESLLAVASKSLAMLSPDEAAMMAFLQASDSNLQLKSSSELYLPQVLMDQINAGQVITLESDQEITLYRRVENTAYVVTLSLAQPEKSQFNLRLLLTLGFYACVAGALLLWLTPLLRSVERLTSAAEKVGRGELDTRIDYSKRHSLAPLENTFNHMTQQLQHLNENNKLLSHAVSHELRTPLARMRFALDMISTRDDADARAADIERMEQDVQIMDTLIDELLGYARLDRGKLELDYQQVQLESFVQDRLEYYRDKDLSVTFSSEGGALYGAEASIDPYYFGKVIDNLFKNACAHAHSAVRVSCQWQAGQVSILVEDDGEGINADDLDKVFEPFVRLDSKKQTKGFGLGLAIVERIVNWHEGSVAVSPSKDLGGACFSVRIPLTGDSTLYRRV